jgi:hypothetical protein
VLVEAGQLLEVAVMDHVIIGENKYTSLQTAGLWPQPTPKPVTTLPSSAHA